LVRDISIFWEKAGFGGGRGDGDFTNRMKFCCGILLDFGKKLGLGRGKGECTNKLVFCCELLVKSGGKLGLGAWEGRFLLIK